MMYVTFFAQKYFYNLLSKKKLKTQIKIFILNFNTLNIKCSISYCLPKQVKLTDIKLIFSDILIYIDNLSFIYLKGTKINFIKNKINSKINIKIPNNKINELINYDKLIKQIKYFLKFKINPKLYTHGGEVIFIKLTKYMEIILKFNGNCNSCFMINHTFNHVVKKKLLKNFPEIKKIYNISDYKSN